MKDSIFEGLGVALVTPYRKGAVDTDAGRQRASTQQRNPVE